MMNLMHLDRSTSFIAGA